MDESVTGGSSSASASAPKGRRFAAGAIDLIIIPIILGVVMGILLLNAPEGVRNIILVIMNAGWLIFRDAVYSPGRALVGTKVVSLSGDKVTVAQAFIRNILLLIPYVLLIGYPVEIISLILKEGRVADRWAKTRVIAIR